MDQQAFYEAKLNYEIDSWDLWEALSGKAGIVVIDARSREAYEIEHIPNAVSFPHREMNEDTVKEFKKSNLYVTYCDGIGCNASTKGALKLVRMGFTARELLGGLDWWKRDGYETQGRHAVKGKKIICGC